MSVIYPNLTAALGHALGMPPNCRKLTLTLEAGKVPKIKYEVNLIEETMDLIARGVQVDEVRRLQFMVRLEPFK
jgi:hypothetical protein